MYSHLQQHKVFLKVPLSLIQHHQQQLHIMIFINNVLPNLKFRFTLLVIGLRTKSKSIHQQHSFVLFTLLLYVIVYLQDFRILVD